MVCVVILKVVKRFLNACIVRLHFGTSTAHCVWVYVNIQQLNQLLIQGSKLLETESIHRSPIKF